MQNKDYQLIPFQFSESDISVYIINREPHWIAADICEILGHSNPSVALKTLDEDEHLTYTLFRAGQDRSVNLVNEAGLYHLIFINRSQGKTYDLAGTKKALRKVKQAKAEL